MLNEKVEVVLHQQIKIDRGHNYNFNSFLDQSFKGIDWLQFSNVTFWVI